MKNLFGLLAFMLIAVQFSCTSTEVPNTIPNFQFVFEEETFQTSDVIAYLNVDEIELWADFESGDNVRIVLDGIDEGIYESFSLLGDNRFHYNKDNIIHASGNVVSANNTEVNIQDYDTENALLSGIFTASTAINIIAEKKELTMGLFENVPVEKHPYSGFEMSLTATVDGESIIANTIGIANQFGTRNILGNYGTGAEASQIQLKLAEDIEVGTYVGQSSAKGAFLANAASSDVKAFTSNGQDEFEITLHDKVFKIIEGTFNYEATNTDFSGETVVVTQGTFKIKY